MEVTVALIAKIHLFPLIPKVKPCKDDFEEDSIPVSDYCDLIEGYPGPPEHEDSYDGITSTAHGRLPHLLPPSYPRSQHHSSHQSSSSANKIDSTTAGYIYNTQASQPAQLRPQPAGGHTEDECVEEREENVEVEICPLSQRARYDSRTFTKQLTLELKSIITLTPVAA